MKNLINRIQIFFGLNPKIDFLSSFLSGSLQSFFLQISLSFFTLISSIIIARYVGEIELGIYTLVFTWISILYTIALFGLEDLSLRQVPLYVSRNDNKEINSYVFWVNKFGVFISFFVLVIFVVSVNILDYFGYIKFAKFYLWGALSIPFFVLMTINQSIIKAIGFISKGQLSEKIFQPLFFIFSLFMLFLCSVDVDGRTVIILRVISFIFACIFTFLLLFKSLNSFKFISDDNLVNRNWYRSSFLFMTSTLLFIINTRIDIIFLGFYNVKPEEIAYYNIALKFSDLSLIPFMVICTVATPIFSKMYHQNNMNDLALFYKRITWISTFLMIFIVLFFVITGNWFLSWYGTNFNSAYFILIILCISKFIHVAVGPANYLLSMIGREKSVVKALVLSVIIVIVLNLIMIPFFGIVGASISTLIGLLFYDLFISFSVFKYTGINILNFK
jgi:O-antigen/teichoic acid export membrane protein